MTERVLLINNMILNGNKLVVIYALLNNFILVLHFELPVFMAGYKY